MPDSIVRAPRAVTASAALVTDGYITDRGRPIFQNSAPQLELWRMYDTIGEYGSFVDWMCSAGSRVRLGAAEVVPGADEPEIITTGPAAQLMEDFYGGTAGHATFLSLMIAQLAVPGEGWLVAERFDPRVPLFMADWSVHSTETIRPTGTRINGRMTYDVQIGEGAWRSLPADSLPVRVWNPHPRFSYLARSPSLAALATMQRLELCDKRIVSELLSRIVMNGILWLPTDLALPVNPRYKDQPNPFWAEWLDIASQNMQNTGSALAAVPMPIRVDGRVIEQIKHMRFSEPFDEQLLAEREFEIARLAKQLPLSPERQQGMSSSNHWSAFVIDESDIKISIAPIIEKICEGLTVGYLQPMLAQAGLPLVGEHGGKLVVWADYSELASPPDKSTGAIAAYDRGEGSGRALRRELGLKETDKPDPAELASLIRFKTALDPTSPANASSLSQLLGEPIAAPAPAAPPSGPVAPAGSTVVATDGGAAGPPQTSPNADPEPGAIAVTAALNGHRPAARTRR